VNNEIGDRRNKKSAVKTSGVFDRTLIWKSVIKRPFVS